MRARRWQPSTKAAGVGAVARASWAVALGMLGTGCFDGADALGLPCRSDGDCGQGQRCEQGFCGGPPATTSETTTTDASTSSSSESSSGLESTTIETTGPLPGCGNGMVEPELGEDCDPGTFSDEVDCDYDCTVVMCGDGYPNLVAGEECDDANDIFVDDCTAECRATLFWDDMETDPALGDKWLEPENPPFEFMGMSTMLDAGWQWPSPDDSGAWYSGPYSDDAGTTRLGTREIFFPDPGPGFHYELLLNHRLVFDGNMRDPLCPESFNDGGVVWASDGVEPPFQVAPPPKELPVLTNLGDCSTLPEPEPDNPLYDELVPRSVYSGISVNGGFMNEIVPLPSTVVGRTLRLVFEMSYDCRNCWEGSTPGDAGWTIESVVVAPVPDRK